MEKAWTVDGEQFAHMIYRGTENLRTQVQTINDLNVFPIPDGDTGDNMLLTMIGGADAVGSRPASIAEASRRVADGMLLSARGNSGVILSQFFDGIATGCEGLREATGIQFGDAFRCGVKHAYEAVLEPTEGTILTVAKSATEYAGDMAADTASEFLTNFLDEGRRTLDRTPEMLPVLKKAGVVDSGGAGLIYIVEGMEQALREDADMDESAAPTDRASGDMISPSWDGQELGGFSVHENAMSAGITGYTPSAQKLDISLFTEDSVLEYGYCTELLIRLQRAKTDVEKFDVATITDYLKTIGDSVVAFKTGSIVKLHVHTKTPDKVLAFCQQYGEFLKVKMENMSLQHNNVETAKSHAEAFAEAESAGTEAAAAVISAAECDELGAATTAQPAGAGEAIAERRPYGVVAVCSGSGIQQMFSERGADVIVDGGQCSNPSIEDFLAAFDKANADVILVLPNNGNIVLAARQAASMYEGSDVRVIESTTIGEGFAALSMFSAEFGDADSIVSDMTDGMEGTVTAMVSRCVRDTAEVHSGDYIGFVKKEVLADDADRYQAACSLVDGVGMKNYDVCILIYGSAADFGEAERISGYITQKYHGKEVYVVDGGQDIYDYVMIFE